ncbi:MAG: sortase [Patescibacteria group bacterium]
MFTRTEVPANGYNTENQVVTALPTRIIIPSVSIDTSVKKALIIRGYWQVFADSAAWGEQSGIPGQVGNQVIFAHKRSGLFLPLKDIGIGAKIYVLTDDKSYSYEVKEIKDVKPNQIEVVAPTIDETLTLYTCSGFGDIERLIVVAKRV